jgi:hypothetical protein
MSNFKCIILSIFTLLLIVNSCKQNATEPKINTNPPIITKINPDTVKTYPVISIFGKNFGAQSEGKVVLNSKTAWDIVSWNDTLIQFRLPLDARTGKLHVESGGNSSNEVTIVITERAFFDGLRIKSGNDCGIFQGDTVNLFGHFLGINPGDIRVEFVDNGYGGLTANSFCAYWSDTLIKVPVPQMNINDGYSPYRRINIYKNNSFFLYYDVQIYGNPVIRSLNPPKAYSGITVTVEAGFFVECPPLLFLNNSQITDIKTDNNYNIQFLVKHEMKSGSLKIKVGKKFSNELQFDIIEPVVIDSITPKFASHGDIITIHGKNFGAAQNKSYISMQKRISLANTISWNNNDISFEIPGDAISGNVAVMLDSTLPSNNYFYTINQNADRNTLISLNKVNIGGSTILSTTFSNDSCNTSENSCFFFGPLSSKFVFDPSTLNITDFYISYCTGGISSESSANYDYYEMTGKNIQLIQASPDKYIYEISSDFPSNITNGFHRWIYAWRESGGKVGKNEGSANITPSTAVSLTIIFYKE